MESARFDSGQPRRQLRRQNAERAEGAVDMKPEVLLAAQGAASAARSSIAPISTVPAEPTTRNGFRPASRSRAICSRKRSNVDPVRSIDADAAQRVAAESRDIHRLG